MRPMIRQLETPQAHSSWRNTLRSISERVADHQKLSAPPPSTKLGVRGKQELIGLTISVQGETGPVDNTATDRSISRTHPKITCFRGSTSQIGPTVVDRHKDAEQP
jgi:hypothetical protein